MHPTLEPKQTPTFTRAWLLANLIGACVFLMIASMSWIEPELADVPGAGGPSAIGWLFTALPFFLLAVVLNLFALAGMCVVRLKNGAWPVSSSAWCLILFWVAALLFDNMHHGG